MVTEPQQLSVVPCRFPTLHPSLKWALKDERLLKAAPPAPCDRTSWHVSDTDLPIETSLAHFAWLFWPPSSRCATSGYTSASGPSQTWGFSPTPPHRYMTCLLLCVGLSSHRPHSQRPLPTAFKVAPSAPLCPL